MSVSGQLWALISPRQNPQIRIRLRIRVRVR